MRVVIFLLLVLWFLNALGQQQQDKLIYTIVEKTDGVIFDDNDLPEGRLIAARMPSHYNGELIRAVIRPIIDADDEISVLRPWTVIDYGYSLHLNVYGRAMTIHYDTEMNTILIAYTLSNDLP